MKEPYTMDIGIDAISVYTPRLYLDISDLAKEKNVNAAKFKSRLGIGKISICDTHEDVCTMAANALIHLILKNDINPSDVSRIYVGSESAVDNSKPIASYVLGMVQRKLISDRGKDRVHLDHCDVVDFTFACIGGVDALHNTLDWVKQNPKKLGIVICTDIAKYEENSSGEYTQGAGAVALLIKASPRVLTFDTPWGVSSQDVHDFFKPRTHYDTKEVLDIISGISPLSEIQTQKLKSTLPFLKNDSFEIFKETPVFRGSFSHQCYKNRMAQALMHFKAQKNCKPTENYINHWEQILFHLPYAFQGQRVFGESFLLEYQNNKTLLSKISDEVGRLVPQVEDYSDPSDFQKDLSSFSRHLLSSKTYQDFIQKKIEKTQKASSEMGNLYTGSIFLALASYLETYCEQENDDLRGATLGFISYGSGSKSKVFEGVIAPEYKASVKNIELFKTLAQRTRIDYDTYQKLHRNNATQSVIQPKGEFILTSIERHISERMGERTYDFAE